MEVIFHSPNREDEEVETGGESDMVEYGTQVVLNIVDFLLVLVNDLVSIEDHVPAKQPGYPGGKQNAEQPVKGLKLFRDKTFIQAIDFPVL